MTHDSRPGLSVLIVEDNEDVADSTAELLALAGHAPRIARCGPEALCAAWAESPDVVLLDLALPGMDGWEVVMRLRAQSRGKQPLVIAVTGLGSRADRERSTLAGIDLHLIKPVEPGALTGLLCWVREALADRNAGSGTYTSRTGRAGKATAPAERLQPVP